VETDTVDKKDHGSEKASNPLWFIIAGLYLIGGGSYSFYTKKWFPGFPIQLDVFSILGYPVGIYVEGCVAFIIGIGLIVLGAVIIKKK
jgi:hypothetical protein